MATARHPLRIDVGLIQLVTSSPAALPTGTRPEAIAFYSALGYALHPVPSMKKLL